MVPVYHVHSTDALTDTILCTSDENYTVYIVHIDPKKIDHFKNMNKKADLQLVL